VGLLRHLHDVPRLVLRIKKVQASYGDWCKLYSSIAYGVQVVDILLQFLRANASGGTSGSSAMAGAASTSEVEYIQSLVGLLNMRHVREVLQAMTLAVDFDASESTGALTMRTGYDQRLDELRSLYDNLEEHLVGAAHKVLDIVPLLQVIKLDRHH
jgi:DNA mismatch repair ATPase MutS